MKTTKKVVEVSFGDGRRKITARATLDDTGIPTSIEVIGDDDAMSVETQAERMMRIGEAVRSLYQGALQAQNKFGTISVCADHGVYKYACAGCAQPAEPVAATPATEAPAEADDIAF